MGEMNKSDSFNPRTLDRQIRLCDEGESAETKQTPAEDYSVAVKGFCMRDPFFDHELI